MCDDMDGTPSRHVLPPRRALQLSTHLYPQKADTVGFQTSLFVLLE